VHCLERLCSPTRQPQPTAIAPAYCTLFDGLTDSLGAADGSTLRLKPKFQGKLQIVFPEMRRNKTCNNWMWQTSQWLNHVGH
jgi:hypothetical protein